MFTTVIVDLFGVFVLFVGKILGTALCTLFTVWIIDALKRPLSPLTVVVVAVVSYRVFSLFAQIVQVGIDTIMVCYMEDLERNKDGALYMSPELHRLLQQEKASAKPSTK